MIKAIKAIHRAADDAKHNKDECQLLAARLMALKPFLSQSSATCATRRTTSG